MRKSFWENFVTIAILLVIVQTAIDDLAILTDWPWSARVVVLYLSFFFDLFFTIEFLVRLYLSYVEGTTKNYFFRNLGWIDLLASIPLLLLNSGPVIVGLLAGGVPVLGFGRSLNVARFLRIFRLLKLLKQLKKAETVMAQRHIGKIASITLTSSVFAFAIGSFFIQGIPTWSFDKAYWASVEGALTALASAPAEDLPEQVVQTALTVPHVLKVKVEGMEVYARFDSEYFKRQFGPYDYFHERRGGVEIFFDFKVANKQMAEQSLVLYVVILGILGMILLIYVPHFALTITEPLFVMLRGFKEPSYNLEVKIPTEYLEDEVMQLAERYNEEYLPTKQRTQISGQEQRSDLNWEAVSQLFKRG